MSIQQILGLAVVFLVGLCQCSTNHHSGQQPNLQPDVEDRVRLYGELVEGGAECQRFRAVDRSYYTLEGDLRGFRTGDTVEITGIIPRASHCMQDTPVRVETIRKAKPPGSSIK
jgi:hypothetical protein